MATAIRVPVPRDPEDDLYPASDGKPLGETGYHVTAIFTLFSTLEAYFRDVPDVYVAADMFLYFEQGNPRACKAPDVMVIKGVENRIRRTFKTWVERAVPAVVFEVTSDQTIDEDLGGKRDTYATLGVTEYFLFDPEAKTLKPALQGFRLRRKKYVPVPRAKDGSLQSEQLGMRLAAEGLVLRLTVAATGERLRSPLENAAYEKYRADALQAEVARLKAELARAKRRKK
jgi:Uma2 family endonuclease